MIWLLGIDRIEPYIILVPEVSLRNELLVPIDIGITCKNSQFIPNAPKQIRDSEVLLIEVVVDVPLPASIQIVDH